MSEQMKKISAYASAMLLGAALLSGCGGDNGNEGEDSVTAELDTLVSAEVIDDINASVMLSVIHDAIDANASNAFGYKAVKITYNTVNENGEEVLASGLLTIPTPTPEYLAYREAMGQPPFSVSMIAENHGTIFLNADAPTQTEVHNGLPDYGTAILMTGYAGFASINPDYIGFGDSNGTVHPYIMKESSSRAALDMLKASMKYMKENNIVLNYQLYISGYSEGGYNAMAMAQRVEEEFGERVNLKGVAAMAGPYNVEDLADLELNASRVMVYPAFLADLAYSYSTYYDDLNLSDIAVPAPAQFETAFSGMYDTVEIHTILGLANPTATQPDYGFYTHRADELFKSDFINDYINNQNSAIRARFIQNNVDDWTPKTKINLIQCVEDEIIPFSEASNTFAKLQANGADVTLSPIPSSYIPAPTPNSPFVHSRCGATAYGAAVKWFDDIRQGRI